MATLLHRLSDFTPLRIKLYPSMLQEIIVFALLAVVLFFLGRALYRMILPKKDDGKGHGGCSGCSGCCY